MHNDGIIICVPGVRETFVHRLFNAVMGIITAFTCVCFNGLGKRGNAVNPALVCWIFSFLPLIKVYKNIVILESYPGQNCNMLYMFCETARVSGNNSLYLCKKLRSNS